MGKRKNQALIDSDSSNDSTSDLDSEFLSLAKKKNKKKSRDSDSRGSESPEVSTNTNSNDKDRTGKKKAKMVPSPDKNDDRNTASEPEEGEVSDSSSSDEEYNDGYDDQLMGDEEDRARLASLTEKERETEIFKRIEQRELMKTRFEIEKKLRQAKKAERAKDKSATCNKYKDKSGKLPLQTDFSSIDHKERSKERKKNIEENRGRVDKRVNAMAELKARREDRQKREEAEEKRREELRKKEEEDSIMSSNKSSIKLKASDIYSDDSESEGGGGAGAANTATGQSEVAASSQSIPSQSTLSGGKNSPQIGERASMVGSSARSRSSSSSSSSDNEQYEEEKPAYVPTKQDMNLIRLSRHKLERFVHMPYFDRIVKGCYIKIGIGQQNNMPVYRLAEIIGVYETAKIYNLGNTRTNKGVRVRHGTQERVFRLEFVSNQEFTEHEYQRWIEASATAANPLPSREQIEQKQADIREALNHEFNEQDIERMIKEKERFKPNPHNYAMRKTQLMKERDSAVARGDDEQARDLARKISDLEERASELDKMRTSTISSISYINDRNRKRNVEEAEKAIMAELKANKGKKTDDPFTRRSTKPRMNFKAVQEEKAMELTAAEEVHTRTSNVQEKPQEVETANKTAQPVQVSQDDLFSAHDFDIKIDLDVPLPVTTVNVTPKTVTKDLAPRRSLNLQDYKKKRGLI